MTKNAESRARKAAQPLRDAVGMLRSRPPGSEVVHQIGRAIVSGQYAQGERLPDEAKMLEKYVVSRTALREAYSKLAAKGLVVARQRVGTRVQPKTHWNMLDSDVLEWHLQTIPLSDIAMDLFALRKIVEPGAAALAAHRRDDDDVLTIREAFHEMEANISDEKDLERADLTFHLAILAATKNQFISTFSALIHAAMLSTFQLSWRGADAKKEIRLAQHGAVFDAIRAQDPQLARKSMTELLEDSMQDVREGLEKM